LQFDPFPVQLIRVVDSSNNEYCLEAITPTTDVRRLSAAQFGDDGRSSALGELMTDLGVSDLPGRCVIDFASRRATHGELGRT
jgi:hypothetical protein